MPHTVTDTEGRDWLLLIHAGHLENVRRTNGITLTDLVIPDNDLAKEFARDMAKFVDCLLTIFDPQPSLRNPDPTSQFKEKGLKSVDDFYVAFADGDVLEKAFIALYKAVIDFSFAAGGRPAALSRLTKSLEATELLRQQELAETEKVTAEGLAELVKQELTSSRLSTNTAESSA